MYWASSISSDHKTKRDIFLSMTHLDMHIITDIYLLFRKFYAHWHCTYTLLLWLVSFIYCHVTCILSIAQVFVVVVFCVCIGIIHCTLTFYFMCGLVTCVHCQDHPDRYPDRQPTMCYVLGELDKKLEPFPSYETLVTLICIIMLILHVEFCRTKICSCGVCTCLISPYSAMFYKHLSGANLSIC